MTIKLVKPRGIAAILSISTCMCFSSVSWAEAESDQSDQPDMSEGSDGSDKSPALEKIAEFMSYMKFETLWYLHYRYGHEPNDSSDLTAGYDDYNNFNVGRGYLTLKFIPTDWFESRITMDAHQDDSGDMKVRLKYLYGKFKVPMETAFITEPFAEVGLVHTPWLDYEEHINYYRAQGTMFMERNKLFNSADFGVTVGTLFGKKLPKTYQKEVNKKYPGSLGSMALGVYNGGGYHAAEENENKTFQARLSVRPLGPLFPNVQLSYLAIVGQGNIAATEDWDPPKWLSHTWMASFEHKYFALTGQYIIGTGNQKGNFVDWTTTTDPETMEQVATGIDQVHEYKGASGFGELKLPWIKSSLIGRYDWFDKEDKDDMGLRRLIAGYAFHFHKLHKNFVMFDFDYVMPDDAIEDAEPSWELKLTLQISL